MRPYYLLPLLCLAVFFSMCRACPSASAPEISLQELHSGCDSHAKARHPACLAAMHRFCGRVAYPSAHTTLGVSRELAHQRIGMSCVSSKKTDVPIAQLTAIHGGCNIGKNQHCECLSAVHRYCKHHHGDNYAGISQEVGSSTLLVHCFETTHKEDVRIDVLTSLHPNCRFPDSHSDFCFSAASRWCNRYFGYSGGITQEVNTNIMTVACYNADFSGDVFITRTNDFYNAMSEGKEVCKLDFDIPNGQIASASPDFLKIETYDNSQSNITLESSFEVAEEMTETNRFEFSSSLAIGVTATVKTGIPSIAENSIMAMTSSTFSLSMTRENSVTKCYVQSSPVTVPAGMKIIKEVRHTRGNLEVPWTAEVVNGLGNLRTLTGKWYGVSTYDFQSSQRNA